MRPWLPQSESEGHCPVGLLAVSQLCPLLRPPEMRFPSLSAWLLILPLRVFDKKYHLNEASDNCI